VVKLGSDENLICIVVFSMLGGSGGWGGGGESHLNSPALARKLGNADASARRSVT